jgi:hypothetical protein
MIIIMAKYMFSVLADNAGFFRNFFITVKRKNSPYFVYVAIDIPVVAFVQWTINRTTMIEKNDP